MNYVLDVHTHTIASGHAYNTMLEMVTAARDKGLKLIGITEHAPSLTGTCSNIYFRNLKVVPRDMVDGIELMLGVELNILDEQGHIDLDFGSLKQLDVVIASLHSVVTDPGSKEWNTNAVLNAIANPYINIIGHPDDGVYPLDYEAIIKAAVANHTILEFNNSSLNPRGGRKNTRDNQVTLLKLCKEYNHPIIVNSDAHIFTDIGRHDYVDSVIEEVGFPEELILNRSVEAFKEYLQLKKRMIP